MRPDRKTRAIQKNCRPTRQEKKTKNAGAKRQSFGKEKDALLTESESCEGGAGHYGLYKAMIGPDESSGESLCRGLWSARYSA